MKVNVILSGTIIVGILVCQPMTNCAVAKAPSRSPEVTKYDVSGNLMPTSAVAFVSYSDLQERGRSSFYDKIKMHAEILDRIGQAQLQARANLDAVADTKNLAVYRAAQQNLNDVEKMLIPYIMAQEHAEEIIRAGYKLRDFSGNVCLIDDCEELDPMIALFFFIGNRFGLDQNLADQASAASKPNDPDADVQIDGLILAALFNFLSDKPLDVVTSDVLPSLENAVEKPLGSWRDGEITDQFARPSEHPFEIVRNIRNNLFRITTIAT